MHADDWGAPIKRSRKPWCAVVLVLLIALAFFSGRASAATCTEGQSPYRSSGFGGSWYAGVTPEAACRAAASAVGWYYFGSTVSSCTVHAAGDGSVHNWSVERVCDPDETEPGEPGEPTEGNTIVCGEACTVRLALTLQPDSPEVREQRAEDMYELWQKWLAVLVVVVGLKWIYNMFRIPNHVG